MEDIKTFLLYLIGLVGLIGASLLFANQGEAPELLPLPATTAPAKISQIATPSAVGGLATCAATAQGLIFNYVPGMSSTITNSDDGRLSISGTIYASDGATPLPGALIEVWEKPSENEHQDYVPLTQIQTGTAGRYTFTTMKPRPHTMVSVYYRVSYQHHCLLAMRIDLVSVSRSKSPFLTNTLSASPSLMTPLADRIKEAGTVFHGPVDIVLPAPPPP